MFRHGIISDIIPLSLCTMSARILITLAPVIQILAPCSVLSDLFSIHIRHNTDSYYSFQLNYVSRKQLGLRGPSKVFEDYCIKHQFGFLHNFFLLFTWDEGGYNIFEVILFLFYSVSCVPLKIIEYAKLLPPFGCIVEFIDFLNMTGIVSL